MAADEIITRAIFKLDADEKGLFAALDSAAAKVRGTTTAFREQEKEIQDLVAREKQLLEERKNANNPNAILKYNQAIKQTRDKITELKTQITASVDATKKLGNEFTTAANKGFSAGNKIKSAFNTTALNGARNSIRDATHDVDKLGGSFKAGGAKAAEGLGGAQKNAEGFGGAVKGALPALAAFFAVERIIAFGKAMVETRAKFEKFEAVLTTTLGSKSAAQSQLRIIQDIAAKTPFSVEQLTASYVKLANQGFKPTEKQIIALGDLAASTGKDFDQLAEAVLDAQTGEFERLKEFGIKASQNGDKVSFTFKGVTTTVKKSDEEIRKYILSLGEAEGVTGSMAAISETLDGKLSNLGDNFDRFFNNLGKGTEGVLKPFLDEINSTLDKFNKMQELTFQIEETLKKTGKKDLGPSSFFTSWIDDNAEYNAQLRITQEEVNKIIAGHTKYEGDLTNLTGTEKFKKQTAALKDEMEVLKYMFDSGAISAKSAYAQQIILNQGFKDAQEALALYNKEKEKEKEGHKLTEAELKKLKDQYDKESESLDRLRKQLRELRNEGKSIEINANLKDADLINAQFDLEKKRAMEALDDQEKNLSKEFKNKERLNGALKLLTEIRAQTEANIEAKRLTEIKHFEEERKKTIIESEKEITDAQIELAAILGETDSETYRHRYAAAEKYYNALIALAQQTGQSQEEINKLIAKRDLDLAKMKKAEADRLKNEQEKVRTEEERHQLEMLDITKAGEEERLKLELQFAKERRDRVNEDNKSTEEERLKAENAVLELEARLNQISEDKRKENLKRILDNIQTITDATINGLQEILDAEIQAADQKIALQQSQIEKAKAIADKGNAELLQEEQERLDNLNKQKAKFVRQQQALALIELVTNSTIAIAKAAAEGGVAAPITITATLIALAAGLVKARQLAAQATFFKGGESEGYTGDGSIFDESSALGKKPYTYHKREFIFNNEKTSRYRPIFHAIHEGKIDLNEWREKVQAFDRIALNPLVYREFLPLQVERNAGTDDRSYKMLSEIHNALKEQERFSLSIDERGIHAISRRLKMRGDTINKLAR